MGHAGDFKLNNKAAKKKLGYGRVQDIRTRYATGMVTQGQLAREYGVSVIQIGRIVRNEVWMDAGQAVITPEPLSADELEQMKQRAIALQESLQKEIHNAPAPDAGLSPEAIAARKRLLGR